MEMESWQFGLLILLAVALGAFLPVLFLLAGTLKELRRRVREAGPKVEEIVNRSQLVAQRLERATQGLEEKERAVDELLQSGRELAHSLEKVRHSLKIAQAVGNSLGPAVATFLAVLREDGQREDREDPAQSPQAGQPASRVSQLHSQ